MNTQQLRQLIREEFDRVLSEWSPEDLDSPKLRAAWSVAADLEKKLKQPAKQTTPQNGMKKLTAYLNLLIHRGPWYHDVATKIAMWAKTTVVPNVKQSLFTRWRKPSVSDILKKKDHPQYAVAAQMFATEFEKMLKDVPDRAWPGEKNPLAAKYGVDTHQPKSDKQTTVGLSADDRKNRIRDWNREFREWFEKKIFTPKDFPVLKRNVKLKSVLYNPEHKLYKTVRKIYNDKKRELTKRYGITPPPGQGTFDESVHNISEALPSDFGMPAYATTEKTPPRTAHGNTPMDKNQPNPEKEDVKVNGGLSKTTKIVKKNEKTNRQPSPNRRENGSL